MKNKHLCKHISLLLAILMLLPLFAFGTTAEEAEISAAQSAEKAEADALAAKKADLVQGLEAASTIFNYVDKASFMEAGHVERLPEEEDLNSYVFRNEDGSKTVYFLDEDVKFVNAGGVVTEKKLELVALDGGYTTRSSNVSLALPTDLQRGITLAHGGATVSLVPNKASLSEAASVASASLFAAVEEMEQSLVSAPMGISLGRADYQNAFGVGTTLRYTPTLSGVKEDVILDRYRGKNSFSFTLNTGNLTVFEENGRYFLAESAEDEEKIFIGETWVYDSADHFEKGTLSVTKKADGVYTLTIGASVSFLTDPDTVYPVYIDPTLTVSYGNNGEGYIEDVTVYSGKPDTNYGSATFCFVGKHPSYGTARTAIRLTGLQSNSIYNALHNAFIDSATLTLRAQTGSTATATAKLYPLESDDWTETGATWNNIGGYVVDSTGEPVAEGNLLVNTNMTFDLTDFVRDWKIDNAHYPNTLEQGFIMVSSDENTTTTPPTTTIQKRFCSSEISSNSYKPVFTLTYHKGAEILSLDQPYRAVGENEIIYVKQGETVQLEAAIYTTDSSFQWTSSNNSVVSVSTTSMTTQMLNPTTCGTATISVANGSNVVLDSIEVYVVPVVPGEYYIETPLYTNQFIRPKIDGSAGDILTVDTLLSNDEDLRFRIDFVPSGSYGYYTIQNLFSGNYMGLLEASSNTRFKFYDNCAFDGARFNIIKCASGQYRLSPLSGYSLGLIVSSEDTEKPLFANTYAPDTNYQDEWIFRRVLPLSGSEKEMDAHKWSKTGLQYDYTILSSVNCFSYAINAYVDENGAIINSFANRGPDYIDVLLNTEENIYEALCIKAETSGFLIERIDKYDTCPEGYYKIALVFGALPNAINDGISFHFYRQSVNGVWTHKLGEHRNEYDADVSNLDADGKIIFDPETCNRNVKSDQGNEFLDDYSIFIGYYAVNPGNVFQPS